MTARIIDGKAVAQTIQDRVKKDAEVLRSKHGLTAGLAAVLIGDNPASKTYVGMKNKMCQELGMASVGRTLPQDISQADAMKVVQELAADPKVHGILVQLPLPGHLDTESILGAVPIEKDIDGFHPINIGDKFAGLYAQERIMGLGILLFEIMAIISGNQRKA